ARATHIETASKAQDRSVSGRGHLGNKQCKLEKMAAIKRELDDFLVTNDSLYRAGLRLCQRDGRGHFDRFALLADFQDQIQPRLLSNLENDSSFNCLLEAGQLAADVVRTDRQQGNRIRAGLIGCRRTFEPRLNIPRNNHCTRYGRARWIKNTATYRCGVLLCKEQKRKNCCRHDLPPKVGMTLYRITQVERISMRLIVTLVVPFFLSLPAVAQDTVLKTRLAIDGQGNVIRDAV